MLLHELGGVAPEQVPTKAAWIAYAKRARRTYALKPAMWDLCVDIDALFARLESASLRAAFVRTYREQNADFTSESVAYLLSQFIIGWYGLYRIRLLDPAGTPSDRVQEPQVVALQGSRFARLESPGLKDSIVNGLGLTTRLARRVKLVIPTLTGLPTSSSRKLSNPARVARHKKRPLEEDAPAPAGQRRALVELPTLPIELWRMIAERITDWQTIVAFSVTCQRFNRVASCSWLFAQRGRVSVAWSNRDPVAAAAVLRAYETVHYQIGARGWTAQNAKTDQDRERVRREVNVFPGQFAMAWHWVNMMWTWSPAIRTYDLYGIQSECHRFYMTFANKLGAGPISRGALMLALAHSGYLVVERADALPSDSIRANMQLRIAQITGDRVSFAPHTELN